MDKDFKISDFFKFSTDEQDEIVIDITKRGEQYLQYKRLKDKNFDENAYFENLIKQLLEKLEIKNANIKRSSN